MSLLIRKIKLFFVKPKIEECIFSYVGNEINKEYYFLMDVYFKIQDTKTKKIISIINEKHISSIKSLQKEITICDQCKICAYDLKKIIFIENKRLSTCKHR